METIQLILVAGVLLFLLYKYATKDQNYWRNKGVKQKDPIPIIGDTYKLFAKKEDGLETSLEIYNYFKGDRFGGFYFFKRPFLVVQDPELLKQIMVKDSDYFVNRYDWSNSTDPLFSKNLVALKDEKWRNLRIVMTTVFTTAKMKDMFWFISKCGIQAVDHVESLLAKQKTSNLPEKDVLEMDFKDFFSRYGTDVIASTAFGLEVDSFKYPDNDFYSAGEVIRNMSKGSFFLRFFILFAFPGIAKKFNLTFFGEKYNNFLISIVKETIRDREENKRIRKDVIHVLMEARKEKEINGEMGKGKLTDFTDIDIAAQAMIFFLAGFETVATLLGFICHELAVHPDIQENLQNEIDEIIERENGITYDVIMHHLKYLDMIVHETLRKWPPAVATDRQVSKTYVIPKTDKTPEVVLNRGDTVWIPIAGLHYDPEYFPDPEKFDPERFRDEKNTIKPFTYLPFGEGIRHCIGMRYALMEVKTVLVHMLKKFTVVPTAKSTIPMKLKKNGTFMMAPENGFFYGLKLRN